MAENDRFDMKLAPGWRTPFKHARNEAATDLEVAESLLRSLAKAFRQVGGVPGLHDMVGIITGLDPTGLLQCYRLLDGIVQKNEGHQHSKVAADVARAFLVQMDAGLGPSSFETIRQQFGERVCNALLGNHFFAIARSSLQELGRLGSLDEAGQWQGRIELAMQPSLERLAARLMEKPDGDGLRAPRRQLAKSTTSSLLKEVLVPIRTRHPSHSKSR